jgi:hypothetical protein
MGKASCQKFCNRSKPSLGPGELLTETVNTHQSHRRRCGRPACAEEKEQATTEAVAKHPMNDPDARKATKRAEEIKERLGSCRHQAAILVRRQAAWMRCSRLFGYFVGAPKAAAVMVVLTQSSGLSRGTLAAQRSANECRYVPHLQAIASLRFLSERHYLSEVMTCQLLDQKRACWHRTLEAAGSNPAISTSRSQGR